MSALPMPHEVTAGHIAPPHPDRACAGSSSREQAALEPALGAMVRLFCARFLPEVEPEAQVDGEPRARE